MAPRLELLDAAGEPVSLDEVRPVDFGEAGPGITVGPRELRLRNAGSVPVYFARVRAVAHPDEQAGQGLDTCAVTTFARTERGDYARELELGTLQVGEAKAFWVRWSAPRGAPAGPVVWAVEALGAT